MGLVACATPYQKLGATGGYEDFPISGNSYHVSFHGNGLIGSAKVNQYFLRRCAEITLEKGFDFFVRTDSNLSTATGDGFAKLSKDGDITLYKKEEAPKGALDAREVMKNTAPD